MHAIDWIVVSVYAVALIALSYYLSKGQNDTQDYYLAGKSFRWWQIGLSTMATQLSAISFISAPAFVGYREGGGLQ
ncbi:MAG: sodium transporter, partial [Balneolaceae bacterium]